MITLSTIDISHYSPWWTSIDHHYELCNDYIDHWHSWSIISHDPPLFTSINQYVPFWSHYLHILDHHQPWSIINHPNQLPLMLKANIIPQQQQPIPNGCCGSAVPVVVPQRCHLNVAHFEETKVLRLVSWTTGECWWRPMMSRSGE